jgi:hypothetical protein
VDIFEDIKLPEIFSDGTLDDFKMLMGKIMEIFKLICKVSQNEEACTFVVPGSTHILGPWFHLQLEELVSKFKKDEPTPPPPPVSPIPADSVTSPEVDMSVPSDKPDKVKSVPPPKKGMSGAPGKPVAAPRPPLPPLPSSHQVLAPKDAPPVSIVKCTQHKQGKHTTHGPSHCGIHLTPPAGSPITAASFTPAVIDSLNKHIGSDLHRNLCLTLGYPSSVHAYSNFTRNFVCAQACTKDLSFTRW